MEILKTQLKEYEEIKVKAEELMAKVPCIGEYDQTLISLNDLIFGSPLLFTIRKIFDDCSYILEMAQ